MIRDIVQEKNPILKKKSEKIEISEIKTPEFKQLVTDLKETLSNQPVGAGISAVQLGVLKRVFITSIKPFGSMKNSPYVGKTTFINPEVINTSKKQITMEEGCLSIGEGKLYARVERPAEVELRWTDEDGNQKQDKFDRFIGRVILHEMDHLEGILFTDLIDGEPMTHEEIKKTRKK